MDAVQKEVKWEIIREGVEDVLRINYSDFPFPPSLEDNKLCMADTVDKLIQSPRVARIIFTQVKHYQYDNEQIDLLREIANLYTYFTKQKKFLDPYLYGETSSNYTVIQYLLLNLLKGDPIGCFVETKRLIREVKLALDLQKDETLRRNTLSYLEILEEIYDRLDKTILISRVNDELEGVTVGNRYLYSRLFRPIITPNFMLTRLMSQPPLEGEELDAYTSGDSEIMIFRLPGEVKCLYHLNPPEFKISEDKQELLFLARTVLSEHKPEAEEFIDPQRMRQNFFNIGRDLLTELAQRKGIDLTYDEITELADILVRYTVGFGLVEVLLNDERVQDVTVNGPIGQTPIFLVHQDFGECVTNIIPSLDEAESWATKFRAISGRPLDEAHPVLDTELIVPGFRSRVAAISRPLNPYGLGYAFRRHRDKPWTLPLFIHNKMISPLGAGLLSFLVDGSRTLLVAGTRSSGKCVDGNTLIQLYDGRILKIKDLVGDRKGVIEDGAIFNPAQDYTVPCLNNFNLTNSRVTDVWVRSSPNKVVRLRTRSGKEIITTPEHPYFVYSSGMKNIRADNLNVGDLIVTPRIIEIKGSKQYIDLSYKDYCRTVLSDCFILKGKTNSLEVKFPKEVTPELAELMGYIIGDGHLDSGQLAFFNSCPEIRARYKFLLNLFNVPYREYNSRTTTVVQVTSRILCRVLNEFFEIPFNKKSDKVVIPQVILASDNLVLSRFLRAYFDTDGYIHRVNRDIELVTASKFMSEQLKMIFLRFGIVSFSKTKKFNSVDYYQTLIRGEFVNTFAKHIGFLHPFKQERLNTILNRDFLENTNIDTIPDGNIILKELRKRLRVSPQEVRSSGKDYWAYEHDEYNVTRNWFKRLISFYTLRYLKLKELNEKVSVLRSFSFNHLSYLSKIEKLKTILGVSYSALSFDMKLSDTWIRKMILKRSVGSYNTMTLLTNLSELFEKRINELDKLSCTEPTLQNLNIFVDSGTTTYSSLSKQLDIPETTLKSYSYMGVIPATTTIYKIERELMNLKKNVILRLNESRLLLRELTLSLPSYVQLGFILGELRTLLNIQNDELVSDGVSSATVSNFFNSNSISDFNVVHSIANRFVDIYDSCVNYDVVKLINEAELLANSDIFWDKVVAVELIDRIDDSVYDLSVENTHNFVANGLIAHNTSLLSSLMVEIMRMHRIITVEDTLEIPTDSLRQLGYNIQAMKVRAALGIGGAEVTADEGIRTSLRLGDSALIVGEIRSKEALALYEAMRVGALANVVAGTIHGDSPYGVFDRVVNDLGVPRTSFKATDIIIVANPVRSADGLQSMRRVVSITEVRKHWENDPLREGGFVDLMKYNAREDLLEPTDALLNGDSEIVKAVAGSVKEWVGNWDIVWENIQLRAHLKSLLVEKAVNSKRLDLLEASFVVKANDAFHIISRKTQEEVGGLDNKRILFDWEEWLKREMKKN